MLELQFTLSHLQKQRVQVLDGQFEVAEHNYATKRHQ